MKTLLARLFYLILLYLAVPLVWLRLWRRSHQQPEYAQHLRERWGYHPSLPPAQAGKPVIWVHAVSVGETRAAQPLIEALLARWPDHLLLLTGMTPTGRETGGNLFASAILRGQLWQAYLPYDYPGAVHRFLTHFRPRFGILMETELWPNLLQATRHRQIPMFLVNARLSERSARGYQRFAALTRPAFAALTRVAAQTEADAERLWACGSPAVTVCGNLKFDVTPAADRLALGQQWRQAIGPRPVWLAASTREDNGLAEEDLILDAFDSLRQHWTAVPEPLLVLVPRHPQRFDAVAARIRARGFACLRRSDAAEKGLPDQSVQVWLGDSMGEMVAYYALADLAFIGGSLLPLGGQNLIEAAACGCPVLVGPHTFNFTQATADALACGAAVQVADAGELGPRLLALMQDTAAREAMQNAARNFARQHQGATGRIMAVVETGIAVSPQLSPDNSASGQRGRTAK